MAFNDYGVNFQGRRVVHPGAYAHIDATAMVPMTPGSVNIPVVLGTADSGEPGVVKWFTRAEDARKYLKGGDLSVAVDLMFSPSPDGGGGASRIGVMVVNPNTTATLTAGGLKSTSLEYGQYANRIQVSLQDGTIAGTKKFTAQRWDTEVMEIYDNLGALFTLRYTGASAYAVVTVTVVDGKATTLETKVGADAGTAVVDLSLNLADERFQYVDDVIRHISATSDYEIDYVHAWNSGIKSEVLDAVADASIVTNKYMMALTGHIVQQVNRFSELVNLEYVGASLTNFALTYLTGGSRGTTPASWSTKFEALKNVFCDMLVVLSSSTAVQAEGMAYVNQQEQRQMPMVMFTGGATGETVAQAKQRAIMLNSSRAVVAYPGIYYQGFDRGNSPLPAYITAAMLCGRAAGVSVSEPITFDYFGIQGLENDMLAGDPDIDDLITSGVATLERVPGNSTIRLVQGITTYLKDANTLYRELSVRRGADSLSETMRKEMEKTFVGKKGTRATISAVKTKAIDVLEQAIRDEDIVAYKDIEVRFVNTAVYVDYKVAPVEPINYVLITSHFVPESTL